MNTDEKKAIFNLFEKEMNGKVWNGMFWEAEADGKRWIYTIQQNKEDDNMLVISNAMVDGQMLNRTQILISETEVECRGMRNSDTVVLTFDIENEEDRRWLIGRANSIVEYWRLTTKCERTNDTQFLLSINAIFDWLKWKMLEAIYDGKFCFQ